MKSRIILFLKGMCMGAADVVPGVSGGTMALILGIYKEFVNTIKGFHLKWLPLAWRWLAGGRTSEAKDALWASLGTLNLRFLFTLLSGIATAIVIGGKVIPYIMENYPVETRAFFCGLILASVYVPVKMIREETSKRALYALAAGLCAIFVVVGFWLTDPSNSFRGATSWTQVQAVESKTGESETMLSLTRRVPSSMTVEQVYWAPENAPLRDAVAAASPERAAELTALRKSAGRMLLGDKKLLKARALPYQTLEVPVSTPVKIPQPALWFMFIAGAVAICAMILPGISGSYILLIFGVYFFVLNALKGIPSMLLAGEFPSNHLLYIGVFITAMLVGILSFARLLSHLLERHAAPLLGALVGLMLGCMRGIWPFRANLDGVVTNIIPQGATPGLNTAIVTFLVGFGIVAALSFMGSRASTPEPSKV